MEYKQNHYVPIWLSKNFLNPNGRLEYLSKDKPERGIEERNPKSVFYENHLYAEFHKDGSRDTSLESEKFNKLDNIAKTTFERLISKARTENRLNFAPRDRDICTLFLYNQMRRTPDFLNEIITPQYLNDTFDNIFQNLEAEIAILPAPHKERRLAEMEILGKSTEMQQRIFQSGKVSMLKHDSEQILNVIWQRGFCLIRPERKSHSFLLGSKPILRLNYPDRQHLAYPSVELVMPIANDLAIINRGREDLETITNYPASKIRYLNELIYQQSNEVAGCSKKLLRSISGWSI